MKLLLLGVTGNVGSRALPALIKHGHTVVAYVRSPDKITTAVRKVLDEVVIGSATDTTALKRAILNHRCDGVFHAAGVAQQWGHSKTGEYNKIFSAVITAIVEARKERGGPAIRAWLMSGFPMMNSINPPHLIGDYLPMFPEHRKNLALLETQEEKDIAWSLFCASQLTPKHKKALIPAPNDCSADNVIANAQSPPEWQDTLNWVPMIGNYLNVLAQGARYATSVEDPVDFIAADMEKGLRSEFVGKRVAFKMKKNAP
jgi:putative NADH-flavin reductase